ncbi:hypothetical protein D910_11884 [Dendroctonus ponderosae]|uniref:Endonuclease/exonuclease/phosphatase domain-containing protein n=1 Tax=Dendroctonus ponderosae TaxID=77166 RepID=U4UNA2_DENPD|nr:hypothetical protein D910_11884 [Dendroctonus ponderosae]
MESFRHQQSNDEVLKSLGNLRVRVESQRAKSQLTQCFPCQLYGHGQSKCTAAAKCVKCAVAHKSSECPIPRERAAKRANCGGAHPASFSGCPAKPVQKQPRNTTNSQGSPNCHHSTAITHHVESRLLRPKSLCVMSWNANGVKNKKIENLEIGNYPTHRADRPTRGGGTLVAVKRSIQHHKIVKPSANLEECIVAVQMESKKSPRSGSGPYTLCPEDVQRLFPDDRPMIHGGDFNARNTNWGCNFNNTKGKMLSNEARKNLFEIAAPQELTHVTQNGRDDILDIFLYKNAGRSPTPNQTVVPANQIDQIPPWLKAKIREKNRIRRRAMRTQDPYLKRQVNRLQTAIQEDIKELGLQIWDATMDEIEAEENNQSIWKLARNFTKGPMRLMPPIQENGIITVDPKEKVEPRSIVKLV